MEIIETYCKKCKRETKCEIHSKHISKPYKDDEEIEYNNEFLIIECRGCGYIGFLHNSWDSNDDEKSEKHYPEDPERYGSYYKFLSDDERGELPRFIDKIYEELKIGIDNEETDTLAGVALRIVIEAVCLHQKISGKNLKEKIVNLEKQGIISKMDYQVIDKIRDIGNVSAHMIKSPSIEILEAALEATNHLLRTVYITRKRTKKLLKKE